MVWTTANEVETAREKAITAKGDTLFAAWGRNAAKLRSAGDKWLDDKAAVDALVQLKEIGDARGRDILSALTFDRSQVVGAKPEKGKYARDLFSRSFVLTFKNSDVTRMLIATNKFWAAPMQRVVDTAAQMLGLLDLTDSAHGPSATHCLSGAYDLARNHVSYQYDDSLRPPKHRAYINQVSLAYTLLTFSYTPLLPVPPVTGEDADSKIARGDLVDPPAEVKDGFVRYWSVVGSMLGIDGGGLPSGFREAGELFALLEGSAPVRETARGGDAYDDARRLFHRYLDEYRDGGGDLPVEVHKRVLDLMDRWPSPT